LLVSPHGAQGQLTLVNLGTNHQGALVAAAPPGFFNLTGGGSDIWDTWDSGAFAYQAVTGDFSVQVRVNSLEGNARWTKAGLMVRESLSESARMAFNRATPPPVPTGDGDLGANDSRFAYRTGQNEIEKDGGANGGRHEEGRGSPEFPNAWLRIERIGNVIFGYRSTDGVNWSLQGSQDTAAWAGGPLPREVLVGLAVSKGPDGGPTATAEFHEYNIEPGFTHEPLRLLSASSDGNPSGITLRFNRFVSADAVELWHWAIDLGAISNVQFGAYANIIHLSTAGPLIEGQTYTLTILGLLDSENAEPIIPDPTVVQFTHGAGYEARRIRLERWNFIPGGSVGPILSSQAYARNLPDVIHSNLLFEDTTPNASDNFSGRIFGVLTISNTGDYRFFACSDDSSVLYLGSDDQPASKMEIAREPEWNGSRQYAVLDRRGLSRANVSAPIRLEAGRRYWLEQVFADAAFDNNASVAWQPPGASEPGNGALPIPESFFTRARFAHGTVFYTLGRPVFLAQPTNQAVRAGLTATFAVRVDGTPPYSYQWQQRSFSLLFANIAGATNAAYLREVTPPDNGTQFRCIVNNDFAGATSAVARLTVPPCVLGIAQPPADTTVLAGQNVTFSVIATGAPPATTYQWQAGPGSEPFTNIPPANSPTLTLAAAVTDNGTRFRCVVGNGCTNVISAEATLSVTLPFVSLNSVSILEGHGGVTSTILTVSLSQTGALPVSVTCVTSDGTAVAPGDYTPVTNTVIIPPGSLTAAFAVPVIGDTLAEPDEFFFAHIVNATNAFFGSAVWEGRILNDDVPPVITIQPVSQTAPVGSTVHFSITAINNPLRYQWFQNGQPLAGQTNATLTLTNVQTSALAFYDATASNDAGSDQSLTAELQLLLTGVGAPQPGLVARDKLEDVLQDEGGGFRAAGFVPTTTIALTHGIPAIFTNVHATVDPGEMHCNVVGGHSMWSYYWRSNLPPATVSASTEGSDFDTVLAVYATSQLVPVSPIPCNNDCGNNSSSVVQFQAAANTIYYLAVDGVAGAIGRAQLVVSDARPPPSLVTPPQPQTVLAGSNATLSVTATGEPPLFYQWRTNGVPIAEGGRFSGASSPDLHITDVRFLDGSFNYTVVVTNCVGATSSVPASLNVLAPPEITLSPAPAILASGSTATFRGTAIGTPPLSYRWQCDGRDLVNGTDIVGADTTNLTVRNVTAGSECAYTLRVTNFHGAALTLPGYLWILEPPFISRQPQSVTSPLSSTVVLAVEASGIHPVSYQWQRNGVNVAGATSPTLTLTGIGPSQAGSYTVRVTDVTGSTTSAPALVTIGTPAPMVPDSRAPRTGNPTNLQELTLQVGANLTNRANIVNAPNPAPAFQWYHNTKPLFGETNDTLVLTNCQPWVSSIVNSSNRHVWTAGHYSITATNLFGGVTSSWCIKLAGELSLDTARAFIDGRAAIRIIATGDPGFILQGTPDLNPPTVWTNLALKCGATCFEYYLPMRGREFRLLRAVPVTCP
jgi:hypothetical protein